MKNSTFKKFSNKKKQTSSLEAISRSRLSNPHWGLEVFAKLQWTDCRLARSPRQREISDRLRKAMQVLPVWRKRKETREGEQCPRQVIHVGYDHLDRELDQSRCKMATKHRPLCSYRREPDFLIPYNKQTKILLFLILKGVKYFVRE